MKRYIAIVLAVIMMMALFTGCALTDLVEEAKEEAAEKKSANSFDGTDYSGTAKLANDSYKSLTVDISANDYTVTQEAVDAEMQAFCEYLTEWQDVTDRPIQDGDFATIDYVGTVDGVEFEGGSATDYDLEIGSGTFIDDFEQQLIGAYIGDEVKVEVTFPEEYHAEELKGADAVFMVTVKAIGVYTVPEMTDELAKELGYESVKQAAEDVRASLEQDMQTQRESDIMQQLWAQVTAIAEVEVSDEDVSGYVKEMTEYYQKFADSNNMDLETYISSAYGMTMDDFRAYCNDMAEEEIKYILIMQELADELDIEIDQARYETGYQMLLEELGYESDEEFSAENGMTLEEMYTKPSVVDSLISEDVMDYLMSNATIKE